MKANRHFIAITALYIIGLAVRFSPLLFSDLPFNIDGFPLVRISEDITESGHWSIHSTGGTSDLVAYNSKMPVLSIIISTFALVFGKEPMEVTQYIIPFLSSISIIIVYFVTFKITKSELVAFCAGLALALNGFFVYLGAAVMKESVALVLMILAIYLYHERNDPRKRILAGAILLLLTLTHHLTVWISFVVISLLMFTTNSLQWNRGTFTKKHFFLDFLSGPFLLIFTILYYELVDLRIFTRVSSINDIALFASVFLLGMIICISYSLPEKRKRPNNVIFTKILIVPIVGYIFIFANHFIMFFPGTIRTSTPFLIYLIPYLLLCAIAIIGLNVIAKRKTEHKPLIGALVVAPFLVILFAFLKGFDAFTFILIYRSYDYVDFGLAICAGIGAVFLIKAISKFFEGGNKDSFLLRSGLSIIFVVICLSTVPLAYQGQELYGVQDITYQHEFEAMNWLNDKDPGYRMNTDERLADIMNPYFDLPFEKTLPLKLKYGKTLEKNTLLFMEDKWVDEGAQMSPMAPVRIKETTFDATIEDNNLLYSTGGEGSQIFIVVVR